MNQTGQFIKVGTAYVVVLSKLDKNHPKNVAAVSCCHWNNWGGLIREHATITFFNDRVSLFDDFEEEELFKYDCGIRF